MTGINYTGFQSNRPFRLCAEYVDRQTSAGNNNGEIDGDKEQSLFKKIIKARYGFEYDFNKDLQTQANQLADINDREGALFCDSRNTLYVEYGYYTGSNLSIIGNNCGKNTGRDVAADLIGYTTQKEFDRINRNLDRLLEDYTPELNNKFITNFLQGYYEHTGTTDSGLFEQLGSESDATKITNEKAAKLMKKIMDAVPEDKRESEDYKTLTAAYQEYSAKNGSELFSDKSGMIARIFGKGYLDNLDDAIERLFNL